MVSPISDLEKITLPTPFAVGDVNVYIVKGDALTLIDAGVNTDEAWAHFKDGLAALGYAPRDIEQVVLTHHHPDHTGLLSRLGNIRVIGHPYTRPWLEQDQAFMEHYSDFYRELFTEFGVEGDFEKMLGIMKLPLRIAGTSILSESIREGGEIPGLAGWKVLNTPGHAQSHLAFYREKDGVLLAGDHVLATISSNPLLEPPLHPGEERPRPQLQYNDSLRKLLDYDISLAFTGHGKEVAKVHDLVNRRLGRQRDRALQVREMLKVQPMTTFEITKQLFPAVYKKELGLTLSETTGQLDYLLQQGLAAKSFDENGTASFRAV